MISVKLKQELDEYLRLHFLPEIIPSIADGNNPEVTKSAEGTVANRESFTLDQLMSEVGESFHEMLFVHIDSSGMTDVEVYKRANIDRKLFSKIRSNPTYHPRKQTVLALAIALKLSLPDTVDLLSRAEYALSPGSKGDLIVKYFIERGIYDIMAINFALEEYQQPILG